MQSNNPVFRRSAAFNQHGNATYPGGQSYQGYGQNDPSGWGVGTPGAPTTTARPMTVDSVVQKSAISLAVVLVAAAATWILTPDITAEGAGVIGLLAMVGGLTAFALSMINSFKRVISPALVIAFAAAEGIALGAISKFFEGVYGGGIVAQAILGTFMAFAGTLAAYKFFNIQVTNRMRKFVVAAVFGMVGLSLMELVLSMFGSQFGLFGVSGLGMVTAFIGLALGVFMLLLDFDFVEQGIAHGVDERESWRAAFALTVSLVWIYTNLLRILAFFQQD